MKLQHTPIVEQKKEFKPIESKPLLFSFLLKTNQKHTNYAIRTAKRTEDALKATL
jgi:hypothetical protein